MERLLERKQAKLFELLSGMGKVLVAYSGGTDSAYLAWAASRVLGDEALAVTADSASIPESHKRDAADFAEQFGIRHRMIATQEFDNPEYTRNDANRCFHCKDELFTRMNEIGDKLGVSTIAYGLNKDDTTDFRPGHRAARQHEVRAPLLEADLAKSEIRALSREAGLPTWDRPAAACLSSRIPYGTKVTPENVKLVERGEEALAIRAQQGRHDRLSARPPSRSPARGACGLEADLAKSEIRALSREAGLPTWDRPAAACLSSRIPYGTKVTPENVKLVERGEEALARLGFRVYRVRYHGELARIEIGQSELPKALNLKMAGTLVKTFQDLGFQYVTLDLAGYRQGSLNEVLPAATEAAFRILN